MFSDNQTGDKPAKDSDKNSENMPETLPDIPPLPDSSKPAKQPESSPQVAQAPSLGQGSWVQVRSATGALLRVRRAP